MAAPAANPCCAIWKERYTKLEEKRNAVRQAVKLLNQENLKIQAEILDLKKAHNEETTQTEKNQETENLKSRVADAETEIKNLKELLEKAETEKKRIEQDWEIAEAKTRELVSEKIKLEEANKKLDEENQKVVRERKSAESEAAKAKAKVEEAKLGLDSERLRFEEANRKVEEERQKVVRKRKTADLEAVKAKAKVEEYRKQLEVLKKEAEEARKSVDLEAVEAKAKMEENRKQLEVLKKEAEEAKLGLDSERLRFEEANRKVEEEMQMVVKERKTADSEAEKAKAKVEEYRKQLEVLKKEAEEARKSTDLEAMKAKARVEDNRKQLEEWKEEAEEAKLGLDSERLRFEEANRKVEEEMQMVVRERKTADSEAEKAKVKVEDYRKQLEVLKKEAEEARKSADLEAMKAKARVEENRKQLEELKKEAEEAKLGLVSERLRFEQANRKVEEERQKVVTERKQVDSEKVKAEEQRKLAEEYRVRVEVLKKEVEEAKLGLKSEKLKLQKEKQKVDSELVRAEAKAEEYRVQLEVLTKEAEQAKLGLKSEKLKLEEANKKLEEEKHKVVKERKRAESETLRAEEQRKIAVEGKRQADGLAKELKERRRKIEELEMKMNESLLYGKFDRDMNEETAEVKLLRKQLKFEKMRVKHAKEVAKWEKSRNGVVRQELGRLKFDFVRISSRLDALDNCFSPSTVSRSKCLRLVEEENLDAQPTISGLSGESTETRSNGNLALVTENSIRGPVGIDVVGKVKGRSRKRKRMLDTIESIECLYSKGKKLNMQIEEKLAALQGMSKNSDTKLSENEIVCQQASQLNTNLIGTAQVCREDISDSVTSDRETILSFEDIADGDYMKLLDLDNAVDEERYRVAMEMPLSPTLPEIEFQGNETVDLEDNSGALAEESFCAGLTNGKEIMVPSSSFNVINVERNSNKLKFDDFGTSCDLLLHKNEGPVDSFDKLGNKGNDICNAMQVRKACVGHSGVEVETSNMPIFGNEGAHGDLDIHLIVFSDTKDSNSISRMFCATRTCVARCSLVSQRDWVVQKILLALKMEQNVSLKEKACVFFSLLLLNFSAFASRKFGNFSNWNSVSCLDSFAGHIRAVMSDVETRSLFAELCCLDDLLRLVEDFLVDGRVMVYNDVAFETLIETASANQLVAGSVILAAICATVDHIGFICETSYNIFRMHRCDYSLVLTILHVFAYLGGEKYFTLSDYSLIMTVLKSIVTFRERAGLSVGAASCLPSVTKVQAEFPPCSKCPFSQNAFSVDIVTSLLLEKLQNYVVSGTMPTLNSKLLSDKGKPEQSLSDEVVYFVLNMNSDASYCLNKCAMPAIRSNSVLTVAFCHLTDVLSLVELVAYNMSWSWTCVKVVPQLLKMLESCMMENFAAALVILLGQLGRLGIDVGGYENGGVDSLRHKLSDFLCQDTTMKAGLPIQIATVTSLLGLLSLDFEKLIQSSMKLPAIASQAVSANLIRKWFSLLSKEQQALSFSILQRAGVNKKLRSFT